MFYVECIDIPGVHIFSKKLHDLRLFSCILINLQKKGDEDHT